MAIAKTLEVAEVYATVYLFAYPDVPYDKAGGGNAGTAVATVKNLPDLARKAIIPQCAMTAIEAPSFLWMRSASLLI